MQLVLLQICLYIVIICTCVTILLILQKGKILRNI